MTDSPYKKFLIGGLAATALALSACATEATTSAPETVTVSAAPTTTTTTRPTSAAEAQQQMTDEELDQFFVQQATEKGLPDPEGAMALAHTSCWFLRDASDGDSVSVKMLNAAVRGLTKHNPEYTDSQAKEVVILGLVSYCPEVAPPGLLD